tara:strand:+ start:571 stop:822 length:252 start_codon:yes stop_codon:yes gene_type:complete
MRRHKSKNKTRKIELDDLAQKYLQSRNTLSDVALLVQRNEDLHNKCKLENERLRLKVNRILRKITILKKKMNEQSKQCQTTVL